MYYGGTQADKLQRRYRRFYAADGTMEITFDALSNKTTFVTYMGGDAYGAPAVWHSEQTSATTDQYFYLFRDYLGSILAITDSSGTIKEKRIFDAWGEVVKLTDGNNNVLTNFTVLDRGYTGHEHLFGVGLVHMNGRLYDPKLHRFLMPDNYVQDPYNTQNFNRYGYVLNNPLKYTDKSGEFFFAAIVGAAIGVIVNGVSNLINGRGFFVGAGKAALFGAIGGVAAFGIGQVAANIATSIGSAAATTFQLGAHAILGGTLSVADGGNFGSGALAGGISSGIGSATGGLLGKAGKFWKAVGIVGSGSVSGGIGSRLGGGNFWDGFRQGAISSGLNHAAHSLLQNRRPDWSKATDQEKVETILESLREGNQKGLDHLDLRKIFRNFPPLQSSVGISDIVGNVTIDGQSFNVYLDVAHYNDMRFSLNGNLKQVTPRVRSGIWDQLTFGAYRGYYIRNPIPILSLQVQNKYFNTLFNYINQ
jgi:RHS repeat-associated protein